MAKHPIPFDNPRTYPGHSGIDFGQPLGTPFRASGRGRVTTRGHNARGGFYVWVQYDDGPRVGYHHMDSHRGVPAVGARVMEGAVLGYVGNTGNSTGPHLHSEVAGHATTAGYWRFFDPSRVVGQPGTADINHSSIPAAAGASLEDDMKIIVQRKNSNLPKGEMTHNRKMREITKWENVAYRKAQAEGAPVFYVTVSDAEYANLLAGKD